MGKPRSRFIEAAAGRHITSAAPSTGIAGSQLLSVESRGRSHRVAIGSEFSSQAHERSTAAQALEKGNDSANDNR